VTNVDDKSGKSEAALSPDDTEFAKRARSLLLESTRHLDGQTLSRLTQARHAALDAVATGSRSAFPAGRWLAPAGGVVAVAAVAMVWFGAAPVLDPAVQSTALNANAGTSPLEDLALMADAESLELLEEIEFYAWLDAEADLPSAAGGGVG
jgi:hypothetical protein